MDREMTLLCVEMKKTAQGVERAHMDAAYAWDGKIKAGLEFVKQVCGESISENLATSFTGQRIEMFQKMAAELAPKAKASSFGVRPDGSKIEALTEQQWVEVYADQRLSDIGFDLPTEELRGGLQSFLAEELRHSPKNALKRVLFECSIEMQCVSQLEVSLRACEEKMRPCTDEFAFLGDEDLYNASVDKLDGVTLRMESLLTYGGRDDDANHDRMMRTLVSIFKSSNVKHSFWGTFEKMAFNRRRPKLWGKMCKVRHGPYRKVLSLYRAYRSCVEKEREVFGSRRQRLWDELLVCLLRLQRLSGHVLLRRQLVTPELVGGGLEAFGGQLTESVQKTKALAVDFPEGGPSPMELSVLVELQRVADLLC